MEKKEIIINVALEKLLAFIEELTLGKICLLLGAEDAVKDLVEKFKFIKAVLKDMEIKQIRENSLLDEESVKLWFQNIKDIAYKVDDVLDEWRTKLLILQMEEADHENKVISFLHPLCFFPSKVALRNNVVSRIQELSIQVDSILNDPRHNYVRNRNNSNEEHREPHETTSVTSTRRKDIIGRDEDKKIIITTYLESGSSSSSQHEITDNSVHSTQVISIVGMGGLGKTALAQFVYNDEHVKNLFKYRIWISVSEKFDLSKIAKKIIKGTNNKKKLNPDSYAEWDDSMHNLLCDSVEGKLFLLVLDNVWTYDQDKWKPLFTAFDRGSPGSRIIVTTRDMKVASSMKSVYVHNLKVLSDDDCYSLLIGIALQGQQNKNKNNEDLKIIGKGISKNCKGLPLAAVTLASNLCFKRSITEWEDVLKSEIWKLEIDTLKSALLLSYNLLPSPLKPCFTYCAIFPKDHELKKGILIQLWMAHGLLNSTRESETLEMIGEKYFNDLVNLSMFQDMKYDSKDKLISFKMHDLLHDASQFIVNKESFIMYLKNKNVESSNAQNDSKQTRHLTVVCEKGGEPKEYFAAIYKRTNVRTLQFLDGLKSPIKHAPSDLARHLTCLRVLRLKHIGLENLPREIGELIHLRCLDVSKNYNLKELPESISRLYNLQLLKLNSCHKLSKLPRGIRKLINLRHLVITATDRLTYLPQGIGRLTSLQTLRKFIVGDVSEGCNIEEFKNLNLLKGNLYIYGLKRVQSVNEASEAMLMRKQHVRGLNLYFEAEGIIDTESRLVEEEERVVLSERMNGVLEALQPHSNLEQLRMFNYSGSRLPKWMESNQTLTKLKFLELFDCIYCTELPALGQLSSLEELRISGLYNMKSFTIKLSDSDHANDCAFSNLKRLMITDMNNLVSFEIGDSVNTVMPSVTEFCLDGCPKLMNLPFHPGKEALRALEKLNITKCDSLRCIPKEMQHLSSLQQLGITTDPKNRPGKNKKTTVTRSDEPLESSVETQGDEPLGATTSTQREEPSEIRIEIQGDIPFGVTTETQRDALVGVTTETQGDEQVGVTTFLSDRCKQGGEDWSFISHIPTIFINSELIQNL